MPSPQLNTRYTQNYCIFFNNIVKINVIKGYMVKTVKMGTSDV
jgi:hypothetical protein